MARFYLEEERRFARLRVLFSLVSEQKLHETPCPLLAGQLLEFRVLTKRLLEAIQEAEADVAHAIHREQHRDD